MNRSGIYAILGYTFKESLRAKWLLTFSAVFFLLAINVPLLVLLSARYLPSNYLSVYLSTLISLAFPFVPLLSLPMGATTIVEERESGTLQYVLSNPVTKGEFLLGRAIGLLLATTLVVFLGFGVAAIFVYNINAAGYTGVVLATLTAGMLNGLMLGLALVISVMSRRKATAIGIAIFIWLLLTALSDLGFLSLILNFKIGIYSVIPILLNPIESSRLLTVLLFRGGPEQYGATGVIINNYFHANSALLLFSSNVVWISVLYAIGFLLFRRQDLV